MQELAPHHHIEVIARSLSMHDELACSPYPIACTHRQQLTSQSPGCLHRGSTFVHRLLAQTLVQVWHFSATPDRTALVGVRLSPWWDQCSPLVWDRLALHSSSRRSRRAQNISSSSSCMIHLQQCMCTKITLVATVKLPIASVYICAAFMYVFSAIHLFMIPCLYISPVFSTGPLSQCNNPLHSVSTAAMIRQYR